MRVLSFDEKFLCGFPMRNHPRIYREKNAFSFNIFENVLIELFELFLTFFQFWQEERIRWLKTEPDRRCLIVVQRSGL